MKRTVNHRKKKREKLVVAVSCIIIRYEKNKNPPSWEIFVYLRRWRIRKRKRECVCVCVCVCETESCVLKLA
jgi:hypothetical protein